MKESRSCACRCYGARTSGRSPWGETPRVADSSAAGTCRVFITVYLLLSRTASATPPARTSARLKNNIRCTQELQKGTTCLHAITSAVTRTARK